MPIGAIISAGANIAGGLLGSKEKRKDRALQKEFAQNAIQWKVEDAAKAGVSPLYALGANTVSYSPVSTGSTDLGSGLAAAGQDVSRAAASVSDDAAKSKAYASSVQALTLQRMGLENQLLSSQIAKINQPGTPPSAPPLAARYLIDGQPSSGGLSVDAPAGIVQTEAMRRAATAPEALWQEPAAVGDVGFARTASGGYAPVMSYDAKQRLEEDFIGMLLWNMRNRLLPTIGQNQSRPPAPVPEGYDAWIYNPFKQEYTPHRKSRFGIYY